MPHADPVARSAYQTAYARKHREKKRAYLADWLTRHPHYYRDYENGRRPPRQPGSIAAIARVRRYGITAKDYDRMLAEQGGGCAMCGRTGYPSGRRLSVDHDHVTGVVRALLCQGCNVKVGHYEAGEFQLVEAYLARFGG